MQVLQGWARTRSVRHAVALGLVLLPFAAACASSARNSAAPPAPHLRLGVTQGSSGGDTASGFTSLARLIALEGLTSVGRDGRAVPRVAQKYTQSNGGLAWTFTLRPNVTFHDGTQLTPEDVRNHILQRSASFAGLSTIADVVVSALDEVTIRLRKPSSTLVEDLSALIERKSGSRTVGTGPFQLVSETAGEAVLEAFPKYYGNVPELNRITLKAYPNFRLAYASLLRGEIDGVYNLGQEAVDFLKNESSIQLYPYMRPYAFVMALNHAQPKLRDARVRQALNMAIGRREIVEAALRGQGQEAGTSVPRSHWAFDERRAGFTYDPARAVALLNAAGLTGRPRLRLTCLLPEGFEPWERVALIVQRQLTELDIDVQFESLPYKDAIGRLAAGRYEALLTELSEGPGMNTQYRVWHSPTTAASWNTWNYRSAQTDSALETILGAVDDTEYRRGVALLQQAMIDDPPAIFMAWLEASRAVSRRFAILARPGQDVRETITSWRSASDANLRRAH